MINEDLYAGKKFYIKRYNGTYEGPRDDIRYAKDLSSLWTKFWRFIQREQVYKFVQVIDGKPVQAFYEDEILVVQDGK